ncbi:hypothetical protein [Hoeflea poritis]|uniref:Uncharacterized protein n=1 Tax=Hoeflea poritis TaxID=2993659 RepID=A0ABT4VS92_9HYPH|nr:hypothetical protein [Hoeflea poritis]MDA4847581.1 hypothetical protein [Hoeflea poritis]
MGNAGIGAISRSHIPEGDGERSPRPADLARYALPTGAYLIACAVVICSVQADPLCPSVSFFAGGLTAVAIGLWKTRSGGTATSSLLTGIWLLVGMHTILKVTVAVSGWSYAVPLGCIAAVIRLPAFGVASEATPVFGMVVAVLCICFAHNGRD